MSDHEIVSVRYLVDDVQASISFYTDLLGFEVLTSAARQPSPMSNGGTFAGAMFRNPIVKGPGGHQILLQDPSGNFIELFQPAG